MSKLSDSPKIKEELIYHLHLQSTNETSSIPLSAAEKPEVKTNDFNEMDADLLSLLDRRDSAHLVVEKLKEMFTCEQISVPYTQETLEKKSYTGTPLRTWELIGYFYKDQNRFYEAILLFNALYEYMLKAQLKKNAWIYKGMPLVWISDCFSAMGFPTLTKRYLMLTLIEDAIRENGFVSPENTGIYFRLVWRHGLSDTEIKRYAQNIFKLRKENPIESFFTEWILQELDQDWMTEFPTPMEAGFYFANKTYIKQLISKLGDGNGQALERLAAYLLSCMPGCRTLNRGKSGSTDYDVICSMEGFDVDFRSELGRYPVCECKDWKKPAGITTMAKFCRILDSIKARFGILFSTNGLSGNGKTKNAEREQLKIFQDRGMIIIVIDKNDIAQVAEGDNFVNLLKRKYEKIRLDLVHEC